MAQIEKGDARVERLKGRTFRILVTCGTGAATSSHAAMSLNSRLTQLGIRADITQCKIADALGKAQGKGYDIIISTSKLPSNMKTNIPILNGVPFITGIGLEELMDQIIEILNKKVKESK